MGESISAASRLNELLATAGLSVLDPGVSQRFEAYLALLMHWNSRLNLTAVRDVEGILSRHFVECILCAREIPAGTKAVLDFGSGAGFPGIPIALCRPEVSVTLAESQGKKAAFLREAVRTLGLGATVYSGRAEALGAVFDCVAMRAVDRMEEAVVAGSRMVTPHGSLVLMVTGREVERLELAVGPGFKRVRTVALPGSNDRVIVVKTRHG
jgi:16S rRNA (guanine527-N7)-methyltransferase